jgi:putative FmdB family regulatory protein
VLRPNESGRETLVDHSPNRKSTTATRLRDMAFSGSRTARACSHHGLLSSRGPRGGLPARREARRPLPGPPRRRVRCPSITNRKTSRQTVTISRITAGIGVQERGRGNRVPNYEFLCEGCGPFEERRSFAEAGDPVMCPSCGEEARRIYSMPSTRRMPAALSNAIDRAEKSAHQPEVVRHPAAGSALPGKRHRPSHGGHCGHDH